MEVLRIVLQTLGAASILVSVALFLGAIACMCLHRRPADRSAPGIIPIERARHRRAG